MKKLYYLRDKDKIILNSVVENYLKVGKPVSSESVAQKCGLSISPAAVRYIMVKLEEFAYLFQPHTSAGRIPTDKGLRFYVNSLLGEVLISQGKFNLPAGELSFDKGDFNSLFVQASKMLSKYSDNLGFVISPRITSMNFHHLRFIKISEEKVMIILVTSFNLALTEIVKTDAYLTQVELDRASRYINENFRGKNLLFVQDYLIKEVPKYKMEFENVLKKLTTFFKSYFLQEEGKSQIFMDGASKLLEKSELINLDNLKSLFQNFEEKTRLARLLSDFISLDRVKVLIGTELDFDDISDCSLILSQYGYDRQVLGTLGIIGPKRIPYKKIIPLVDYVAQKLSQTISINQ